MVKYLVFFSHDRHWLDFRYAELDSLLVMFRIEPRSAYDNRIEKNSPFLIIDLPNADIISEICSRSVLIKAVLELWVQAPSLSKLWEDLEKEGSHHVKRTEEQLPPHYSFTLEIESFGRSLRHEEKEFCRRSLSFLDFAGIVQVSEPSIEYWTILDWSSVLQKEITTKNDDERITINTDICNVAPAYFGKLISHGGLKETIHKFDLKNRLYLGPTSLDHSLALILCNLAGTRRDMMAFDPFVGTASILIALSHFGAMCSGADIDPRVLHGQMYAGKADRSTDPTKRDIFENFRMYHLPCPELMRLDNHLVDRHFLLKGSDDIDCCDCDVDGSEGIFDVIVTDPPYGIRAGAKKSGRKTEVHYTIEDDKRLDHIPSTQSYPVEEVMLDLLHSAAKLLALGGTLTYLIPTTYDFEVSDLPLHPCLVLTQTCEQPLSSRHGRRAVVMKKVKPYTSTLRRQYREYKESVLQCEDGGGFSGLLGKLKRALAAKAFEDEAVCKRAGNKFFKRKANRLQQREKKQAELHRAALSERGADCEEHGEIMR